MSVPLKNFNHEKQIHIFQYHFHNSLSTVCNEWGKYKVLLSLYMILGQGVVRDVVTKNVVLYPSPEETHCIKKTA